MFIPFVISVLLLFPFLLLIVCEIYYEINPLADKENRDLSTDILMSSLYDELEYLDELDKKENDTPMSDIWY